MSGDTSSVLRSLLLCFVQYESFSKINCNL